MPVWHDDVTTLLDFHVFEVSDFDILIGHPIEKLLSILPTGGFDMKLGRRSYSIPILGAKNPVSDPLPPHDSVEDMMVILLGESLEKALEEDSTLFIQEEDDSGEVFELPKFEPPSRPSIELKALPSGLRYAFLHGNTESHVIISDKLSEAESSKLIAILEKHRSVFGYSL